MKSQIVIPEWMLSAAALAIQNRAGRRAFTYTELAEVGVGAALRWFFDELEKIQRFDLNPHEGEVGMDEDADGDYLLYSAVLSIFCAAPEVDEEKERYRNALKVLAKLGNGEVYGNSDGNIIAQKALGVKR